MEALGPLGGCEGAERGGGPLRATEPGSGAEPRSKLERLEFHWTNAPVPAAAPASDVPPGFENRNSGLDTITSLYWAKGREIGNVQEAVAYRWLLRSLDWFWDPGWTVAVPHTIQRPGEARTWYVYVGATARPSQVARRLPDGTVHEVSATVNYPDNVTQSRDAVGRETTYTYAANGIDLLEVRNTTGGQNVLLASYGDYTAGHLPQTMTDAAGQTTQTTYNAAGQVLTVTNAKQETTTYAYDANGYLETVTGPVAGATVTYTYDAYGRVRSATPAGEAVVTQDYDALNRPTRTTYPDGTYEETTYERLDAVRQRDRRGRITQLTYNARRQLIAARDPAGRVVQQQWCGCGALDALIDANGNATRWERDAAGRVLREIRADGVTDTDYTYDALGRLRTVTDPKQQVTTYTYHLDGSVATVAYTNAQIATPGVAWTYDPAYPRVTTMVDGTGTTTYTYHPSGQLGAGQVATVDGPLANDVISYTYEPVGRVLTRAIDEVPLTLTYDPLGRVAREVNVLGTFDYTLDGTSGRLATVTYPNTQTSTYTYYPAGQDHRLQQILHRYPNGTTLSQFDYAYDAVGNITSWRQQADTTAVIWEYAYDGADQLVRALKRATDPQGTSSHARGAPPPRAPRSSTSLVARAAGAPAAVRVRVRPGGEPAVRAGGRRGADVDVRSAQPARYTAGGRRAAGGGDRERAGAGDGGRAPGGGRCERGVRRSRGGATGDDAVHGAGDRRERERDGAAV